MRPYVLNSAREDQHVVNANTTRILFAFNYY